MALSTSSSVIDRAESMTATVPGSRHSFVRPTFVLAELTKKTNWK
jgi:hypothetical protein